MRAAVICAGVLLLIIIALVLLLLLPIAALSMWQKKELEKGGV